MYPLSHTLRCEIFDAGEYAVMRRSNVAQVTSYTTSGPGPLAQSLALQTKRLRALGLACSPSPPPPRPRLMQRRERDLADLGLALFDVALE